MPMGCAVEKPFLQILMGGHRQLDSGTLRDKQANLAYVLIIYSGWWRVSLGWACLIKLRLLAMWQPQQLDHISQRKSPFQSILHQFFSDTQYFYISIDPMVYKRDWRWSYDDIGSEGFVKLNYVKTRTIQSISAGNRSYSRISHSIQVLKSMFFLLRIYYYVRHIMSIKFIYIYIWRSIL